MDLLSKLINLEGISGNEHSIRKFIIKEAKKYFSDVKVDKMGNVVVRKKGIHPRVLLLAESGSRATVIETYVALSENKYFTNCVSEMVLHKNATIEHYRL